MTDRRFSVGSLVDVSGRLAEVVSHGRDAAGVYTRVRHDDGSEEKVHRSMLRAHAHVRDGSCDCYYWKAVTGL